MGRGYRDDLYSGGNYRYISAKKKRGHQDQGKGIYNVFLEAQEMYGEIEVCILSQ